MLLFPKNGSFTWLETETERKNEFIASYIECVFWVHFVLVNIIYSLCSFCCADPCFAEEFPSPSLHWKWFFSFCLTPFPPAAQVAACCISLSRSLRFYFSPFSMSIHTPHCNIYLWRRRRQWFFVFLFSSLPPFFPSHSLCHSLFLVSCHVPFFLLRFCHSLLSFYLFHLAFCVCVAHNSILFFQQMFTHTYYDSPRSRPENSTEFMRSNLYPHTHTPVYVCDESQNTNEEKYCGNVTSILLPVQIRHSL